MINSEKMKILFLCTGNSCRSQMAEGFARTLKGDLYNAYSAGVTAKGLDPLAVKAMAEVGVDISDHISKELRQLVHRDFDWVVTVCNKARESCPVFPGAIRKIHKGFDDPPELAAGAANEEEALTHYRRVRDEIRAFVEAMPGSLEDLLPDMQKSTGDAISRMLRNF